MASFTVQGTGVFPFDMLRFDRCFPASPKDAVAMDNGAQFGRASMREVTLTSDQGRAFRPNVARWESFGWRVIQGGV